MATLRVLLVEDNAPVAQTLAGLLGEDVDVRIVYTAADAVTTVAHFEFDVILMDLGLTKAPGLVVEGRMDSLDLTPAGTDGCMTALAMIGIWYKQGRESVPIIAITGGMKPIDPLLETLADFVVKMRKPFLGDDLTTAVAKFRK